MMRKMVTVSRGELVFAIVLLIITFVGIEYLYYVKDITGHFYNIIAFFPLLIAIRFARVLIAEYREEKTDD